VGLSTGHWERPVPLPEHCPDGADLDGIAERCARAVILRDGNVLGPKLAVAHGGADAGLL